jgi:hypothetical protein
MESELIGLFDAQSSHLRRSGDKVSNPEPLLGRGWFGPSFRQVEYRQRDRTMSFPMKGMIFRDYDRDVTNLIDPKSDHIHEN